MTTLRAWAWSVQVSAADKGGIIVTLDASDRMLHDLAEAAFRALSEKDRVLLLGDLIPFTKETAQAARDILADTDLPSRGKDII